MIHWIYLLVAACALLLFLFYKEWVRKDQARLWLRLVTSLLAVTSLLFMAYPYAAGNTAVVKKIVLLTDGFNEDSLDNFLHQNGKDVPVFFAEPMGISITGNHAATIVSNWQTFAARYATDTIHVFGDGLNKEALAALQPHPVIFHANKIQPAITHIYWKQNLQAGEPLTLQGRYENAGSDKITIMLEAFGVHKDSIVINSHSGKEFSLHTVPVHTGKAVYSLVVTDGNNTLAKEPVPVNVQNSLPLRLLIISSAPDFENTFLKNMLSQQGYPVSVKTTVSTNKTDRQFLNITQQTADHLTAAYLEKFDVIMADEEALSALPAPELQAIRTTILEKGTGLVIKMTEEKNTSAFYSPFFPVKTLQPGKQSLLHLHSAIADSNRFTLKVNDQVSMGHAPGTQVLLQDEQENVYASAVVYGSGKLVATTLLNTYSIALAGNKAWYQQLWWLLLHKAAKQVYPEEIWKTDPFIASVDHPVHMQVESNSGALQAMMGQAGIYLLADEQLPYQLHGKYWPTATGWQFLPVINRPAGDWYVYGAADWKQIDRHERLSDTKQYANSHPLPAGIKDSNDPASFFINRPLLLFIVFLSCCFFLWVEQKAA